MNSSRLILLVSFIAVIFSACEKDFWKRKDFRDKYVGKYQVSEELRSYGSPQCGTFYSLKDTLIIVDFGSGDSTLFLLGREVQLDEEGYYYAYHFGLRLWNDSIWSLHMNGGLGCGIYETYEGKRISSKP